MGLTRRIGESRQIALAHANAQ
ncbi:hypothetical protein [Pseudomonas sp. R1-1]